MLFIIIFITTKSSHSIGPKGFISRQGEDSPMKNIYQICPKAPEVSPVQWYLFIGFYITCWQQSHMGKKGPGSKLEIGLALPDVWDGKIKMQLDQLSSSSPLYIDSVKILITNITIWGCLEEAQRTDRLGDSILASLLVKMIRNMSLSLSTQATKLWHWRWSSLRRQ